MGRVTEKPQFSLFFRNILWLNMKRVRNRIFWRILLIAINFMLLYCTFITLPADFIWYIFSIVTLSNILFIYSRVHSDNESLSLLRTFGATRTFIIFNHMIEILMEIIIAFLIFIVFLFFKKPVNHYFLIIINLFLGVIIITPLFSLNKIRQMEKQRTE
jgi:hypothetical protein